MIAVLAALLLGAAQEDLNERLEALGPQLLKDGASLKLAELCAGEFGRAALRERIEELVAHRAGPIDRDPLGQFENAWFTRAASGELALRPERKADFDRLARDVSAAPAQMAAFNRRAFAFAARIRGEGALEQRARAWWSDSTFRTALFSGRAGDLIEQEIPELLEDFLGRALVRGADGALRVEGELRDRVHQGLERLERIRELREAYLKRLSGLGDADRKALSTEEAVTYVLDRLIQELEEELPDPIGSLEDGDEPVAFKVPLTALLASFREAEAFVASLAPWFEEKSAALASGGEDERTLAGLLTHERGRMLVVGRLLGLRGRQRRQADAVFREILEEGFEAQGDALTVKKGRYRGEDGADSPEAFDGEMRSRIDDFRGSRRGFDLLAEHCADPAVERVFASLEGTTVLHERVWSFAESLRRPIEEQGFRFFTDLYLVKKGGTWEVRPERALRIHALAERAERLGRQP